MNKSRLGIIMLLSTIYNVLTVMHNSDMHTIKGKYKMAYILHTTILYVHYFPLIDEMQPKTVHLSVLN